MTLACRYVLFISSKNSRFAYFNVSQYNLNIDTFICRIWFWPEDIAGLTSHNKSAILVYERVILLVPLSSYCMDHYLQENGIWTVRFGIAVDFLEPENSPNKQAQLYFPCKFPHFYTLIEQPIHFSSDTNNNSKSSIIV